ncbi:DUF2062 domain-containing protein [Parvibaculum sp.]|uniref:DUF2062 domain-containing protein n=1 Tax=Parvibaculum sp. TaxID=2024848 RepID=UPI002C676572|nr:DUF2062 domain-containing protein [Parvibaculum sp.]HUD52651.1 DUF2062 domain-containing protein [Parvibaculum sp.]
MFRRRVELHPLQKLREALWPRIGWKRATQYVWRRVWRLSGTPHTIAVGVAAGAFISFTPFLGFHIVFAIVIAWVLRGNLLAAAFGTLVGNPLSYPPIWFATYDLGSRLLGMSGRHHVNLSEVLMSHKAFDMVLPVLVPMALGSIPLGLAAALVTYFIVKTGVAAYQLRRREQLEARILARQAELDAGIDDDEQE